MEWKDVQVRPTGITRVALGACGLRSIPVSAMYKPRCHGNWGAMLTADAHLRASVKAGDDREAVEFRCSDIVTDDTTIRDAARVGGFRHVENVSLKARYRRVER